MTDWLTYAAFAIAGGIGAVLIYDWYRSLSPRQEQEFWAFVGQVSSCIVKNSQIRD